MDCWFGLNLLHIFDARVSADLNAFHRGEADRLREWALENRDEFGSSVLQRILKPFKYSAKLYGERADSFFGPVGSSVSLRLVVVDGHEVLVARRK